jgi:hypothetical protein
MLWIWNLPEAATIFAKMGNRPLAQAVAALDQKSRVMNIRAKVERNGTQAVITYDMAKNPWYPEVFIGENITMTPRGLQWMTTTTVTGRSPESSVPTLQWKGNLLPPYTMVAHINLQPKTHFLLFGVESSNNRIRIGFNNTRAQHTCVVLATKSDGEGFELVKNISAITNFKPDTTQKVEIKVDVDYRVSLYYNDQKLTDALQLPKGSGIAPIVQAIQLEDGLTTIVEITQLTLTGSLPTSTAQKLD